MAKSPRFRFRPTVRSDSPITAAASPEWQRNQTQSNQIKVNQGESNLIQPIQPKKRMNATEWQSQGTAIYAEEAIQLPANGGSRAGSAWLFLRAWAFPLTPALSRRERGNVAAPFVDFPSAWFHTNVGSDSPKEVGQGRDGSGVQPCRVESNLIQPNPA